LVARLSALKGKMRSAERKPRKLKSFPVGLPQGPTVNHGLDQITLGGHQPDVTLMNTNLSGISGIGTLKIRPPNLPAIHLPFVAISAKAMPQNIEKGPRARFFRYLTKPIRIN